MSLLSIWFEPLFTKNICPVIVLYQKSKRHLHTYVILHLSCTIRIHYKYSIQIFIFYVHLLFLYPCNAIINWLWKQSEGVCHQTVRRLAPPNLRRRPFRLLRRNPREVMLMNITLSELFQFCLVIIGILNLVFQNKEKWSPLPSQRFGDHFTKLLLRS